MKKFLKEPQDNFLSTIVTVYVIAILAGMLLIYHDFYYDILETKYIYYCSCTIIMLFLVGSYLFLTQKSTEIITNIRKRKLFDILSPVDCSVVLWGICILAATIFSPEKELAFWGMAPGIGGRYTGCFLLLLYIVSYFCITRYYRAHEWHIAIFLGAGLVMCLFGITDFFDLDILHFKEELKETQHYMFTSTIGNINTYTSCVAMIMAVLGVLFATSKDIKKIWIYALGTFITYIALILGESDNAYLSLAAFFGLLPFYLFRIKGGIQRYFLLLAGFFSAAKGISLIQKVMKNYVAPIHGLFQYIANYRYLTEIVVGMWLIVLVVCFADYKVGNNTKSVLKWPFWLWTIFFSVACMILIFIVYDVNVAGNVDRYGNIKQYLLFNDEWGTHRGYIWKIGIENYLNFPTAQKLLGYGPDTFGAVTRANNYAEMVERYSEIFDSAHNEYLQYLITVGPLGLLSYLSIHITTVIQVVKKKSDNPLIMGTLFAVLCYVVQATVNINQPIATPIMWTLLSICMAK